MCVFLFGPLERGEGGVEERGCDSEEYVLFVLLVLTNAHGRWGTWMGGLGQVDGLHLVLQAVWLVGV